MDIVNYTERYLHQIGIADPSKFQYSVTILGVGQIGSATAVAVSKLGCPHGLTLIDDDYFEEHNLSNQMCLGTDYLNFSKVDAIGKMCEMMGSITEIKKLCCRLKGDKFISPNDSLGQFSDKVKSKEQIKGIVISTPDNMTARRDLWNICKFNPNTPYLIDARMAGQYLQILVVKTLDTFGYYEKTLFAEQEATPESCSASGIIYTGMVAGGLIASIVKKIQLDEQLPREIRLDIATFDFTVTLNNGKTVSNSEELAKISV